MEIFERVDKDDLSWELYSGDHLQRYDYFKDFYKDKIILDAACGSGYGSEIMIKNGAKKVIGIDVDKNIIEKNKKKYHYSNLEFYELACENIRDLKVSFDLIVSFETIEHLKSPDEFIKQTYQVLNKDGLLIISSPNVKRFSAYLPEQTNEYHLHEFDFDELKQLLIKENFKIIQSYHQSESLEFLRYLELQHNLHQLKQMMYSSISFRIEKIIRKLFNKPLKPMSFFYPYCHKQTLNDFHIEEITESKEWYKTFILIAQK